MDSTPSQPADFDFSRVLYIVASGPVSVTLTDKYSRRLGYHAGASEPYDEIPMGVYIPSENDEGNWLSNGVQLMVYGAESGSYTLEVIANGRGAYSVMGTGLTNFIQEGEAQPGMKKVMPFTVPDVIVAIPSSDQVDFLTSPPEVKVGQYVMFVFSLSSWFEDMPAEDESMLPTVRWDFGDGSSLKSDLFPVHIYSAVGVYTVMRRMTDLSDSVTIFTEVVAVTE